MATGTNAAGRKRTGSGTGAERNGEPPDDPLLEEVLRALTAARDGDFSVRLRSRRRDVAGEIARRTDELLALNHRLTRELARVSRVVGRDGRTSERATAPAPDGAWVDAGDSVNALIDDLVRPTAEISRVIAAVAAGDLTQKMAPAIAGRPVKGEFATLAATINSMTDTLRVFSEQVTGVARAVGTDGALGGQAEVRGASGTWRDLTESVNQLAGNLTTQVRAIAEVTTAVARGDLSRKIDVEAKGEIAELKDTINTMVDQLNAFSAEVTRVAREVGTEGRLGGQAQVRGVNGMWRDLTESVNQLAGNLTTQVRAIAEVSTAVTRGDLSRQIDVDAEGEVAELSDTINQMIANLRETTRRNAEQDWLNTNLARISGLLQGQRDMATVARMIMSEVSPLVGAQHGAFFLAGPGDDGEPELRLIAGYGYREQRTVSHVFRLGEGLVGQAALQGRSIVVSDAPADYVKVTSGLGEATPVSLVVMPVLFEEQVMGVVELASLQAIPAVDLAFLEQLAPTLGVVLNAIVANRRTEELLEQSQSLTEELQTQSEELQAQQEELKRSNAELEQQAQSLRASEELLQTQQEELQQTNEELQEKAELLSRQNRDIEFQNSEIEKARADLEEKAEQLAQSSRYKSEFLANMSHELRTPLNALLILSQLLAENPDDNLTDKQVEFAATIHTAGADLLSLISDILDLSKVEAGKMEISAGPIRLASICEYVERAFGPVAEQRGIEFRITTTDGAPATIFTDEQRLQQVLRNLLSNAFKFTDAGHVELELAAAPPDTGHELAVTVRDTGIGIAEDKLRLVFEAFQQADGTTSRRFGGTGLGLSISREIAHALGGEIQARSVPGEGSAFTLLLAAYAEPAAPTEPAAPHPPAALPEPGEPGAEPEPAAPAAPAAAPARVPAPARRAVTTAPEDLPPFADDRARISPGDRVALIVDDDESTALRALVQARQHGFLAVVAPRGNTGVTLAHELTPDVVLLAVPVRGGIGVLDQLKHHPRTRHIPVYVCAAVEERIAALRAGAAGFLARPVEAAALGACFGEAAEFLDRDVRRLLVVEDDEAQRLGIVELVGTGDDVEVTAVGSSDEALAALEAERFDCIVLDLSLPETSGFALLDRLQEDEGHRTVPVIVHTGRELSRREETRLRRYADSIIVKDAGSPERLLDETALFLHREQSALPPDSRRVLEQLHTADAVLPGKRVLIVDDDVRNVFALTSALEARGMEVRFAENGRDAIAALEADPGVDLVLMDVMMPEMDGYETTRALRADARFEDLPVIALTAKAMKGDREKSIAAGASDYITKPVDIEQLISLMRVWLYG